MLFLREKNVVLAVHSAKAPTDAEWGTFMELLREVSPRELRILAITDGGSPNVHHRALLNEYMAGAEPPISVVSSSLTVRGVATAISWFNKRIRAFDPAHIDSAFDHIGFAPAERSAWLQRATKLAVELDGAVESLDRAAGSVRKRA